MTLDEALTSFTAAFAAGSSNSGIVQFRSPRQIAEPMPLGPILRDYYARLELGDKPIVGGALQLRLWTLDELETNQHGWRWIRHKGGPVTEEPTWNKHWIVIADRNGNAIIVDDSTAGGTVYGAIGSYNFKIADDLASFFQTMAETILVEVTMYDYEVYDDDFNCLPGFLDEMRAISRRVLGSDGEAGFMEYFFG